MIDILVFVFSTIVFLYVIVILFLIEGFYRVYEEVYLPTKQISTFSVVVSFRNEEKNLTTLINSFKKLKYSSSMFEILLVDDYSDDGSYKLVEGLILNSDINFTLLKSNSKIGGKKHAITYAISKSKFSNIITTDADCTVQPLWLNMFDQKLQKYDLKMLAGPVKLNKDDDLNSFMTSFQQLDLVAMIGSTIGGFGLKKPFLCNGANLMFNKQSFYDLGGYERNINIASGDDLFLMETFVENFPNNVKYLKAQEAIVSTNGVRSVKEFINQRMRWAAKSSGYNSKFIKSISVLIAMANVSLLILFFLALFQISLKEVLIIIAMKFIVDFWMIKVSSNFLMDIKRLYYYPAVAITYPFYIVFVAILSQTKTFTWKGRNYAK
ncbi:MAG: glycosyltransferase [Ichthyobacteriaceae bacterium]|nr:glycosyltransferase [Ichthyobacteriaceae bacterium]